MSITGNILIDKLRINIPIPILEELGLDTEQHKQKLKDTLIDYFYDKTAFSVTKAYGYIRITLTPTRFKPNDRVIYTDTNLEMPSETWLYNLFNELGFNNKNRRIVESSNITWIHLTKNIITENAPFDYIMFLHTYPLKKRFISSLISSNEKNASIRLSTPKRDTAKKDIIGDRTFIFYDKTQELLNKAKKDIITLKYPLTDDEIKYISLHGGYKIEKNNILNISGLNLLRCELQYKYKDKLKPLQNFLNPKSNEDSLTMATIFELLSKNELYKKLDEFYTNELQDVVFYRLPNELQPQLTSYKRAFADLISNTDLVTLELLYDDFNMGKIFRNNVLTLKGSNIDLYTELHRKFIEGRNS